MRTVIESTTFRRDLKRMKKRGKDLHLLFSVVEKLAMGRPLEAKHCPHPLVGHWKPKWDCHIEPDWLLLYETTASAVKLVRTGTHADLFK